MFIYHTATPTLTLEQVMYLSAFSIVMMGVCYYFERKDAMKKDKAEKSSDK